jgi:phosphoribosylformylglycinamidine cyclo-ligase
MPGFYADGEYDVAGFIVGAVPRDRLIDGARISAGDVLIGIPSSGLHTNGYSLARRIAFEMAGLQHDSQVDALERSIGEALLVPHRSYLPVVRPLLEERLIKGMAHITGGGITDNLPRILPGGVHAEVDPTRWRVPAIFHWLQRTGEVSEADMFRTFNMGIGLIIVCAEPDAAAVVAALREAGESAVTVIGRIGAGGEGVRYARS